jgi:MarR family transcriptional regulator for hemolysin
VNETTVFETGARTGFEIYRAKGTTPEIRLMVLVVLAGRRWRAVIDEHLRPLGQSAARLGALAAIINTTTPSSQSDIAKRLRIEGPTMTRMIDSLTRDGLVERRAVPGDRRTKHLVVTPQGEAALEQMFAIVDPLRAGLVGSLSPDDVERLTQMLGGMVGRLDRGLGDGAGEDG